MVRLTKRQILASGLSAFSCGCAIFAPTASHSQTALPVVASFSILGDWVQEIGGERVSLRVLVGPGGDVHAYAPGPQDARTLSGAKLIFAAGLGFESWLKRLVKASGSRAQLLWVNEGITPRSNEGDPGGGHPGRDQPGHDDSKPGDHDHADHNHGSLDPHAWQDVANAKIYVNNIAKALIAADPQGQNFYEARQTAYIRKLEVLDQEIRTLLGALPKDRRKLVTTHEAFGYFASAYGLEIIAPAGMSGNEAISISAQDVARVVRQIREDKISAIFWDNPANIRIAEQIARESGARLGGYLYGDALSPPDGPAGSYIAMMLHNAREIANALSP